MATIRAFEPSNLQAGGIHRLSQLRSFRLIARAGPANQSNGKPEVSNATEEARLELLEASVRGNKRAMEKAKKSIPIRGMNTGNQKEEANSNLAPWKEGQLFPEGWDNMPITQKAYELYMGRRGVLFWANKAAYASVFILIGGWVIFRFVGPNLGFYTLQGDLAPPPF